MDKYVWSMVAVVLLMPGTALAAEYRFGENPSLGSDERITDDVYLGGGNITSAGEVDGDLLVGGGSMVITGAVTADVTAAGGNVSLLAPVSDDVRIAGGTVIIEGTIGDDLHAAGGQLTVGGDGIGGDAALGGGMVRLDAPVSGDLTVGGGNVYLNAPVSGDVTVEADTLTLGGQADISGDLVYTARQELTRADGAVVSGEITFTERPDGADEAESGAAALLSAAIIGQFLALLASALIVGLTLRRYGTTAVEKASRSPLLLLGLGLVAFAALPVISGLLMATLVGIPLGILGFIGFIGALIFSWIMSPIILGSMVSGYFFRTGTAVTWKTILLGVVLYSILGLIPVIGWLAQGLLLLIALGSIVTIKGEVLKEWR